MSSCLKILVYDGFLLNIMYSILILFLSEPSGYFIMANSVISINLVIGKEGMFTFWKNRQANCFNVN